MHIDSYAKMGASVILCRVALRALSRQRISVNKNVVHGPPDR